MLIPDTKALIEFNRRARVDAIPLTLNMELTARCSLDCKMCYVHLTKEQLGDRKELTAEQWKSVVDEAVEMGTMSVLITGGECLMHKDFKEIYMYVLNKPVLVSLNTNATLINDDYLDFFTKYPPHRIKISLYAASEEGYERVTGHRMYARVRDNILKLKAAGVYIKMAITVCKQSYDETLDLIKFAQDNDIEFAYDMTMIEAQEGTGRSSADYALTPEEIITKQLEIAELQKAKLFENEPITELPARMDDAPLMKGLACGAGRSVCTVCWDGDVQPCLVNKIPNTLNVLDVGLKEAWERTQVCAKEQIIPIECETCKMRPACYGCAFQRMDPNDPGHRNLDICRVTMNNINAGISKFTMLPEGNK